jgi:2-haloalkanoic acid dehalogenase type II
MELHRAAGGCWYRRVSFDADGTLLDFERVMRDALERTLGEIRTAVPGPAAEALTVERLIATRDLVARELRGHARKMERLRLLAFERTLEEIGNPDPALAARLTDRYLEYRFYDIQLYPDVIPALDALEGKCGLGLASNGNSYPERSGLAGRFDWVVLAQEVGHAKPSPYFYQAVLEAAGASGEELVHVGDSLANDVEGARGAGIRTVWLNRDGARNDTGARPDWEIRSLDELPALLL